MPRSDRVTCKNCGRHRDECGPISHGGYCGTCGPLKFAEWNDGLHFHTGPALLAWRRSVAASIGAVLLDDLEAAAR